MFDGGMDSKTCLKYNFESQKTILNVILRNCLKISILTFPKFHQITKLWTQQISDAANLRPIYNKCLTLVSQMTISIKLNPKHTFKPSSQCWNSLYYFVFLPTICSALHTFMWGLGGGGAGLVLLIFNPSTVKAQVGESLWVPGQPGSQGIM